MSKPKLLSIVELGGYPDFAPLYEEIGYEVVKTDKIRKAVKLVREFRPDVIVAEFNYQSDFRDRTSSLETILSSAEGVAQSQVIVFYEREYSDKFERFLSAYEVYTSLVFPIDEGDLRDRLLSLL